MICRSKRLVPNCASREGQLEQAQRAQSERASRRTELETHLEELKQGTKRLEELREDERESLNALDKLRKAWPKPKPTLNQSCIQRRNAAS